MKYQRKAETIHGYQLDFSDKEKMWKTLNALDMMNYTLIHRIGDKFPKIRLAFQSEEYGQGDYIYMDSKYEWHGCHREQFEQFWEEQK